MVGAKVAWGQIINGRVPNQNECTSYLRSFQCVTRDPRFPKTRACPALRQCFTLVGLGNGCHATVVGQLIWYDETNHIHRMQCYYSGAPFVFRGQLQAGVDCFALVNVVRTKDSFLALQPDSHSMVLPHVPRPTG